MTSARATVAVICVGLLVSAAAADTPLAERVAAFEAERAASKASATDLAVSDEFAARAKAASGDSAKALRLIREARRAIPVAPAALPAGVIRRFGTASPFRHGDRVNGMSISADGRRLATASRDNTVKIWDLDNGRELLTYRWHQLAAFDPTNVFKVPNVAFSPDGKTVASSGGKVIHIWDAATGKPTMLLLGHAASARGLAFTPDGKTLISGGDDRRVIVWDIVTGKAKFAYPDQSNRVEAVSVSAGKAAGLRVAAVNASGELLIYPLADGVKPQLLGVSVAEARPGAADGAPAFAVAFVGETGNVLTCGGDARVRLTTGPEVGAAVPGVGTAARLFSGHAGQVNALAVTPDGTRFVSGGADRTARVWETATGKVLAAFATAAPPIAGEAREAGVSAVAIAPDGTFAVTGTVGGQLQFWPLTPDTEGVKLAEATDALWSVAASPGGTTSATVGADKVVRLYDAASSKLVQSLTGHAAAVPALAYLDETRLATASGDKLVKLWDTATGQATDCVGHTAAVLAVAAHPPSRRLFSGGLDKSVRAWSESGKPLGVWSADSPVTALAVRPDGQRLAVGTADGTLTILSAPESGTPVRVGSAAAHTSGVGALAFHPDGVRLLTCGGDGLAKLWTVPGAGPPTPTARLEPALGLPATGTVPSNAFPLSAAAFSPDGSLFAVGGSDAAVRLWSTASLSEVRAFRGHADWVTGVAFSADGRGLLSTSVDQTLRRFELPRPDNVSESGHRGPVTAVAVSPNGTLVATAGRDRAIKVWTRADGKLVATFVGSAGTVTALGFLSEDSLVSTGGDGRVRWWALTPTGGREVRSVATSPTQSNFALQADPKTGRVAAVGFRADGWAFELYDADGKSASQVVDRGRALGCANFTADLSVLASSGRDGVVKLWDFATRERVGADWLLAGVGLRDLAFTPDGTSLVAIDDLGFLRVATVTDRAAGAPFVGGRGAVGLVTAPAGDRFGVFFDDGTVKTWTLDGKPLKAWKLPAGATSLAFTPDGQSAAAGLADGTTMLLE